MSPSPRLSIAHRFRQTARRVPLKVVAATLMLAGLGLGGCAQSPQQLAAASSHGKEYFPSSVYGRASRRMVADGQPVPRGGGQYLVGKPYSVAGRVYVPSERRVVQVGNASWYGDAFHGRLTANGEIYDSGAFTAAHPTMPLPSYARVTNLRNNYSMIVRVNDRGPYASNRVMDVSSKVAEALDFKRVGTAKIKVEYVGRASLAGSDDARLYATLRTNGPANATGIEPTMVAESAPPARVASLVPYVPQQRPREMAYGRDEAPRPIARRGRIETEQHEFRERESRQDASRDRDESIRSERRPMRMAMREEHAEARAARTQARELLAPSRNERSFSSSRHERTKLDGETRIAAVLPPSRPMDLGTIPGAGSQIGARHHTAGLRLARARDD